MGFSVPILFCYCFSLFQNNMRKKNLFNSFVNKLLQTVIWLFVRENKQQEKKKKKKPDKESRFQNSTGTTDHRNIKFASLTNSLWVSS